jgi:hypothetical protein
MLPETQGSPRACRLCGGAMIRTGIERDSGLLKRLGSREPQEQLRCASCATVDWIDMGIVSRPRRPSRTLGPPHVGGS